MRRWNVRNFARLAPVLIAVLTVCPELTRDGGNARAQNVPAPEKGGIFVPKPREAGATLDEMAVFVQGGATVATRMGDRLTGMVTGITRAGLLRLSAPCFDGEVGLFTSAISEVRFSSGAVESGKDEVTLTNGDRLCGNVTGMTATGVALENSALGLVKIGNPFIRQITFRTAPLVRTDFSTGQADPLLLSGGWQVSKGALHMRRGTTGTAALALDQKSAITVVVDFALVGAESNLSIFSDDPTHAARGNSLILNYKQNAHSIIVSNRSNAQPVASNLAGRSGEAMGVRFAYDPAKLQAKLWVNDQLVSETKTPNAPKEGKFIVLVVNGNWAVNRMDVLSGVIAPVKVAAQPEDNNDVVILVNQDRYRAEKLALADGKFAVKTASGVVVVPAEKVAAVNMSKATRQTPAPPEHAVQVVLPNTSLTVEMVEMTGKTAFAKSPCLGDVQIDREAIRILRFLAPPAANL